MKNKKNIIWFTLVELIVSITILSMILVAVVSIFLFATQMSTRVELNRTMQENAKNVLENIAEWVRKNGLEWTIGFAESCTDYLTSWEEIEQESGVCIWGSVYTIWFENELTGKWERSSDIKNQCQEINQICRIIKKDPAWDYYPLTNGFVAFQNLKFIITNKDMPKLFIQLTLRPAAYQWMSSDIIIRNEINIQTTVSQKLIETQ